MFLELKLVLRWRDFFANIDITLKTLEQGTPWDNLAELCVGILKSRVSKDVTESNSLRRLWDYFADRSSAVHNLTSRDTFKSQGLIWHAALTGD